MRLGLIKHLGGGVRCALRHATVQPRRLLHLLRALLLFALALELHLELRDRIFCVRERRSVVFERRRALPRGRGARLELHPLRLLPHHCLPQARLDLQHLGVLGAALLHRLRSEFRHLELEGLFSPVRGEATQLRKCVQPPLDVRKLAFLQVVLPLVERDPEQRRVQPQQHIFEFLDTLRVHRYVRVDVRLHRGDDAVQLNAAVEKFLSARGADERGLCLGGVERRELRRRRCGRRGVHPRRLACQLIVPKCFARSCVRQLDPPVANLCGRSRG